jgi:hypothetical protein
MKFRCRLKLKNGETMKINHVPFDSLSKFASDLIKLSIHRRKFATDCLLRSVNVSIKFNPILGG